MKQNYLSSYIKNNNVTLFYIFIKCRLPTDLLLSLIITGVGRKDVRNGYAMQIDFELYIYTKIIIDSIVNIDSIYKNIF